MDEQQTVKTKYPEACAVQGIMFPVWIIWQGVLLLGCGKTEDEAWGNTASKIMQLVE